MQEGYSARELSAISRSSPSSIRRIIRYWLSQSPPRDDAQWRARLSQCRHVIVDGTILRRKSGEAVYAVMESNSHELLYGGYGIREGARDLQWVYGMLAQAGLHPNSATIDGNPQQARYLYFNGLRFACNGAWSTFNAKGYVGVGEIPNGPTQNIFENSFSI